MSRSYKNTPGFTYQQFNSASKFFKRYANKQVRKNWNIDDGGDYKKIGDSYAICDYKSLDFTGEEHKEWRYPEYKVWIK